MMFSDVPNLLSTFGYINASWTLKADLAAEFSCRLLDHTSDTGMCQCTPRLQDHERNMAGKDWIESFSSGYIQRKIHLLPKQGDQPPWVNTQNYALDKKTIVSPVKRFAMTRRPQVSGETGRVYTPEKIPAIAARQSSKLTQTEFAKLLDVSVDAIRDREQGRRSPRGAARTLLRVAMQHPDVLRRLGPRT